MLPLPCMLVCTFVCANRTRDRGCSKHPVFPAPSNSRGREFQASLGQFMSRDRERIFSRRHPPCAQLRTGAGDPVFQRRSDETIGRGVLDPPPSRGRRPCGASYFTSLRAQRSNPPLHSLRYGLLRCARNDVERVGFAPTLTLRRPRSGPLQGRGHRPATTYPRHGTRTSGRRNRPACLDFRQSDSPLVT